MLAHEERIFQEMTKKAMVAFHPDGVAYLTCKDHHALLLQEHFNEGYMECTACGWRITLEQARTLVNDMIVSVTELFDLLNEEIVRKGE